MVVINRWSDYTASPENNPIHIEKLIDKVWTTRDGKKLLISEMSDEHVKNCYHMVRDSDYWKTIFKLEIENRGLVV